MSRWHTALLALALAAAAAPRALAYDAGKRERSVAVVLSMPPKDVHMPTMLFYKASLEAFAQSQGWTLAAQDEVKRYLPKPKEKTALDVVPLVSREAFVKSHLPAKYAKDVADPAKRKKNGVNKPLQYMLDSLAIQGAVVVDCVPSGKQMVRACGLYYYDRSAGKVVASARKYFRVGVQDSTRWAPEMVASLAEGIKASAAAKDKHQIEAIMARGDDEEEKAWAALQVGLLGETTITPGHDISSVPSGWLTVGRQTESTAVGLEVGVGGADWQDAATEKKLLTRQAGLSLTLISRALDSLLWEAGLGIGFAERRFTQTEEEETSLLRQREAYLSLRPGMMWDVGSDWHLGGHVHFTRYLGGERKADEKLAGDGLNRSATGLSFGVRKLF